MVGIDTSIIANPAIWKSSGHVDGFSDPMVDCKETKLRYRADQLFWSGVKVEGSGEVVCYVCVQEVREGAQAEVEEGRLGPAWEGRVLFI